LRRYLTQFTIREHSDRTPWTVEEDRKLEGLAKQGFKAKRITSEMDGRSYNSVHQRLTILEWRGLGKKRKRQLWTAEEAALLREKKQQGLTPHQVLEFFLDRSLDSIRTRWQRATFWPLTGPKRSQDFTEEQVQRVIHMRLEEAKTLLGIAEELNCTFTAIEVLWQDRCDSIVSQEARDSLLRQRLWTPQEVKHLSELHHRGTLCTHDVALRFPSKTHQAIMNKSLREGLSFPRHSQEDKEFGAHKDETGAAVSHD